MMNGITKQEKAFIRSGVSLISSNFESFRRKKQNRVTPATTTSTGATALTEIPITRAFTPFPSAVWDVQLPSEPVAGLDFRSNLDCFGDGKRSHTMSVQDIPSEKLALYRTLTF
jgi:hypothetical protein